MTLSLIRILLEYDNFCVWKRNFRLEFDFFFKSKFHEFDEPLLNKVESTYAYSMNIIQFDNV